MNFQYRKSIRISLFLVASIGASISLGFAYWKWVWCRQTIIGYMKVDKVELMGDQNIHVQASIPAEATFASNALISLDEYRKIMVCGNFYAATIRVNEAGGNVICKSGTGGMQWSSEMWQRALGDRVYSASWFQAADGSIRVAPEDPLLVSSVFDIAKIKLRQDLWVKFEAPRRGRLRAITLATKANSGEYRPLEH